MRFRDIRWAYAAAIPVFHGIHMINVPWLARLL